jgi:hypothetical protein
MKNLRQGEGGTMRMIFIVLISLRLATFAWSQDKTPTLNDTLQFMQGTLSSYGFLHSKSKDQELVLKGDEPCSLYVDSQITYSMHSPQDGEYDIEYQFNLRNIDPSSVKVNVHERTQRNPIINVHLETTNNKDRVWASASKWKENPKLPKILQLSASSAFDFEFRDPEHAEKFAKALRHAIELCGGKQSAF